MGGASRLNLRFLADALATMRARARNFMARSRWTLLDTGAANIHLFIRRDKRLIYVGDVSSSIQN